MQGKYILIGLVCIVLFLIWHIGKRRSAIEYNLLKKNNNRAINENINLSNENVSLRNNIDYLKKVIVADENIFKFIRCINIPMTPVCEIKKDGGSRVPNGKATVCRSRQIDCNKFRLVLERDPIAKERMRIATDKYTESQKRPNQSELSYPVRSGWLF